jgi:hypothetical protein
MRAVFTVSSPNYLGYSISLFYSLIKYNNDVEFYIALFRPTEIIDETKIPKEINIIYIDELGLDKHVSDFAKRYPINKVCMAFKPIVAQKILTLNKQIQNLVFFDSDILIYNTLTNIWNDLQNSNIILTPHLVTPLANDLEKMELRMLSRAGVFNTGFFAVKRSEEADEFLSWWFNKLTHFGLLGDQVWLNFAPTFFNIKSSNNIGNNVAFYNLPNRKIKYNKSTNKYVINGKEELVFFHFIKHNPFNNQDKISSARLIQKNITFENLPELKPIFNDYKESLEKANFSLFKNYIFKQQKQTFFIKKYVHYKHQLIRVLYKIIFDVVSL